jgi:hypothetical protein
MQSKFTYLWILTVSVVLSLLATAFVFRPKPAPIDPFIGLWEFWANSKEERQRYLSVTRAGEEYGVLRADSVYPELAAVARGHAVGGGSSRRVEVTFPDGERFVLTINGADELIVSFYKPSQPEDIYFSYFRSGARNEAE